MLDKKLTDDDPAFDDVQSHRLLALSISLTKFDPILRILLQCEKTIILSHVVH